MVITYRIAGGHIDGVVATCESLDSNLHGDQMSKTES